MWPEAAPCMIAKLWPGELSLVSSCMVAVTGIEVSVVAPAPAVMRAWQLAQHSWHVAGPISPGYHLHAGELPSLRMHVSATTECYPSKSEPCRC